VGAWSVTGGRFILTGCPDSYALVNERDGVFNHDIQHCQKCYASQYQVRKDALCQDCPKGRHANTQPEVCVLLTLHASGHAAHSRG
jgi:hypothetical protein